MTTWTFILKNALRNPRRSVLTVSSVAVSAALLTSMMTLQRELTVPPESEGASLRIIARNKVSLVQPLPARQLAEIERIPGIVAVTPFTYFGSQYNDEEFTSFAQFAVDPRRFRSLLVEGRVSGGDYEAALEKVCSSGYLQVETRVEVPGDARGMVLAGAPAADPAPYGHSTKIAVLRATRKDGRAASA